MLYPSPIRKLSSENKLECGNYGNSSTSLQEHLDGFDQSARGPSRNLQAHIID